MKKRLSDDRWQQSCIALAIITVLYFAFYGFQITHQPIEYSIVRGDLPLLTVPPDDPSYRNFSETAVRSLSPATTTIVLDDEGHFFFGDVTAFTSEYQDVRNKFVVKPRHGAPQTGSLLEHIRKWQEVRQNRDRISPDKIAVLVPQSSVPMAIVIQVMADLRYSELFDRVVLANGMM